MAKGGPFGSSPGLPPGKVKKLPQGVNNNRLRLTQQYVEVAGLGATTNKFRLTQQYVEVVIALAKPTSFASVI